MPSLKNIVPAVLVLIVITVAGSGSLFGQATNGTGTWNRTAAGTFNWAPPVSGPDRNWWALGNGNYPSGLTAVANLNNNILGNQSVDLQSLSIQVLTLNIGDSTLSSGVYNNFTVVRSGGSGTLTIGSTSGAGTISSSNGANTISAAITLGNAATFQHTTATGSLLISGSVSNGGNLLTVAGSGNTSITGVIGGGSGGLTMSGAGVLTLGAANTYTGATTVSGGTLEYGINDAILNGSVTVIASSTLDIKSFSDTVGTVQINGGTIAGTTGVLSSTANFDGRSGTVSAILGGSVGLDKTTAGTLALSKANTYTGTTTVNAGTLQYGTNNAIATGGITVNSGGTLDIGTFIDTVGAVIIDGGAINGTSGVLTSTIDFDGRSGTVLANLGGGVGFTKSTTGSLTLGGTNTYTGPTMINAGTLVVDGSTASSSTVTVNATGVLGGSGTIFGDVNVVSGEVAPGMSPSTLTVDGDFSMDSGAVLTFEFAGNDTTVGGGVNDLITGVNDLTLDGSLNVIELGAGSFSSAVAGQKWRIFNYSGVLNNFGLNLGSVATLNPGLGFYIDTDTFGQVNLGIKAIPEPGSLGLLAGLTLVGAVVVSRRRRKARVRTSD